MTKRAPFEKLPGQIDLEEAIAAKDARSALGEQEPKSKIIDSIPRWNGDQIESSSYHGQFFDAEAEARAAEPLLAERGSTHGSWDLNSFYIQGIKDIIRSRDHDRVNGELVEPLRPVHQEALEMFAVKIGRILAGDPECKDHWDDIAGYAKLASTHCKTKD